MRGFAVFLMAVAFSGLIAKSGVAETPEVVTQTRLFLDAYARGDRSTIARFVEKDVAVYGSDFAEMFHGTAALEKMITDDQRLWGGTAHIGAMEHVSVIEQGVLASIFFDASFSAGGQPPAPVRFAMVWRRSRNQWRLVQSSNVVPTQGQSAAELLARRSGEKSH